MQQTLWVDHPHCGRLHWRHIVVISHDNIHPSLIRMDNFRLAQATTVHCDNQLRLHRVNNAVYRFHRQAISLYKPVRNKCLHVTEAKLFKSIEQHRRCR